MESTAEQKEARQAGVAVQIFLNLGDLGQRYVFASHQYASSIAFVCCENFSKFVSGFWFFDQLLSDLSVDVPFDSPGFTW